MRVDDAFVDLAHGGKLLVEAILQGLGGEALAGGAERHLPRQQIHTGGIGRQRVRLAVFFDLQAVLEVAQELVGSGQARILGAGEQPFVAQAQQRDHGAAVAHPLLAPAMQALQALSEKFDIANAAGREFDIETGGETALGGQLLADALARFRDRFHGAKIERRLIDQGLDEIEQRLARLHISRGDPRLDEHLLFPIPRALKVVSDSAIH